MLHSVSLAACLLGLTLLGACEDDAGDPTPSRSAGGAAGQGGTPGSSGEAGNGYAGSGEAGSGGDGVEALGACLDRPGELPRPPRGGLPCELFPPGYSR